MARLGVSKKKKSPRATQLSQLKIELKRVTEQLESCKGELAEVSCLAWFSPLTSAYRSLSTRLISVQAACKARAIPAVLVFAYTNSFHCRRNASGAERQILSEHSVER
jgi:hypothetical protein